MISCIRGTVLEKRPPFVVLDVNGVGYEAEMPMSSFFQLPNESTESVLLYVHEVIREDAYILYGFISASERSLFREILKVNSVGPKTALVILSNLSTSEFIKIILEGDVTSLTKLPTIGKKSAERIIIELKDRLEKWSKDPENTASLGETGTGDSGQMNAPAGNSSEHIRSTAVAAMLQLGYNQKQADEYVAAVFAEDKTVEQIIKEALQMTLKGKKA